eukprot:CAMPEP_0202685432 /NCGR_PEP_ID=MMETSP1385-20130828/1185_1 /ASSEMBLY_ACC=CAM_ASM_000861 /TAXON_ID=933848 /ORGANISM="Elphidium margaritaceum" /LENGTH=477 /DNA_ID=CAMNT_0049339773 /DNA_START=28 /DNA_END=1461 /DNA_ORIENTATION=+
MRALCRLLRSRRSNNSNISYDAYMSRRRQSASSSDQVTAILGAQWGDEGKGKLVDILASKYDICARFNGGSNAGHTLVVDGQKFAMHLLPCGVLNSHCTCVIGNGVVVHVPTLMQELQSLLNANIGIDGRILISDRAHIVFDFHQEIDGILENLRDAHNDKEADKSKTGSGEQGSIGTTRRGIGPCYASKMYRNGLRFGDLLNFSRFKDKYLRLVEMNQKLFTELSDYNTKEEIARFESYREILLPMIQDTIFYINHEHKQGKRVLLEGANAALLDIDFGTYPMVTASSTCHGGIATGAGLAAPFVTNRIGVVKAYTTRVGHGPFPTEQRNEYGEHLGTVGAEFGTTTGRKRRCGWLDIPLLQYSNLLNAYSSMNITKLDVLDDMDEIQIGTAYTLNGQRLSAGAMPSTMDDLAQIEVEYETLPGWNTSIAQCKTYQELPTNAKKYIETIERLTEIPVSWIGVGPDRHDMINKLQQS